MKASKRARGVPSKTLSEGPERPRCGSLLQDRNTGKHRGFGFVAFASKESAEAAVGKRITIKGRVASAPSPVFSSHLGTPL